MPHRSVNARIQASTERCAAYTGLEIGARILRIGLTQEHVSCVDPLRGYAQIREVAEKRRALQRMQTVEGI